MNGGRLERMGVFYAGQYAFANVHVAMTLVRNLVTFCAMCGWCPACHHQCAAIMWTMAQTIKSQVNMIAFLDKEHGPATEGLAPLGERGGCFFNADPGVGFRNE